MEKINLERWDRRFEDGQLLKKVRHVADKEVMKKGYRVSRVG